MTDSRKLTELLGRDVLKPKKPKSTKFVELFGRKPIIAGVYPIGENPVDLMISHVLTFLRHGVEGVYLENNGNTERDIQSIEEALQKLKDFELEIKIGVNILPDYNGTEHVTAFRLAREYDLPFIMLDMIAGKYKMHGHEMELDGQSYFDIKNSQPDVVVIGGINPPYATLLNPLKQKENLRIASSRADAIMVKKTPREKEVPLDRLVEYALQVNGLPLIPASAVRKDNVRQYVRARNVGGLVIGSAFREDNSTEGALSDSAITEICDEVLDEHLKLLQQPY